MNLKHLLLITNGRKKIPYRGGGVQLLLSESLLHVHVHVIIVHTCIAVNVTCTGVYTLYM